MTTHSSPPASDLVIAEKIATNQALPSADSGYCAGQTASALNEGCFCIRVDSDAVRHAVASELDEADLFTLLEERCPYVFATGPVFISHLHIERMKQLIGAIESVVALPTYRQQVLSQAPAIANHSPGNTGVFFGYDFHVHEQGVSLIEINTNAGGAMLNTVLAKAQRVCCEAAEAVLPSLDASSFETDIVNMFQTEWFLSRGPRQLKTIAIVDEKPSAQYLYPEFLLFQRLFKRHGINAVIADPAELTFGAGVLRYGQAVIDLVYNRLTDFMLEAPGNSTLRAAYLHDAVVLTPHPQAHALYANKRNLAILTDPHMLSALGVPQSTQTILLANIPHTEIVNVAHANRLWSGRRTLFFKPIAGFGSRAAYRGDKITKRVWEDILTDDYVAQAIVAPGERATGTSADAPRLKFDIRAYAYTSAIQWVTARLYQGQTTNFRTPGGGFAPVYRSK